jgi:hypothetical protein
MRALIIVVLVAAGVSRPAATQEPAAAPKTEVLKLEPLPYPSASALSSSAKAHLQAEWKAFAQDLRGIYSWRSTVAHKIRPLVGEMAEAEVEKLLAEAEKSPLETPQDGVARFYRALAARVPAFAKAMELAKAGKCVEAAAEVDPLMKENPYTVGIKKRLRHDTLPPYCYSAIKFFYAECLGREGNLSDCSIAYHVVYMKVPNSLVLGAPARYRVARFYDQTARAHYAIPVYQALALRLGHLLSDAENLRLAVRAAKLSQDLDPYRLAERRSSELLARLERDETGPLAGAAGEDLTAQLRAMMVTVDEEARPFLESTMAIVQGAVDEGRLRSGKITDQFILDEAPEEGGDDQWGKLPPRERQQLLEAFKEKYPERYSEMLELYYRRVSELESRPTGGKP